MGVEEIFLTAAADKLAENLSRIETCVPKLPPELLWARDSENENAVGNLLLHLEGNLRQWIVSGLGGAPGRRDRPGEFAARSGPAAPVLMANLRSAVADAIGIIRDLPQARLREPVTIQRYDTTVLAAIFHVVEHFSGHTYQIILITKQVTREDLGFYSYLTQTGGKETD
jgi:uncharacterized damage-inducible protein DinB